MSQRISTEFSTEVSYISRCKKKKNVVKKKVCISILTVIALQSEDIQQENLLHTNCLGQTGMCVFYKQGLKKI